MANKGDDCYFFYYSTCTKGDACPFRHCEAAMGNETVCSLWEENRCFRSVCKFRHMEIKKNRKEIPCYWENQPGGCQKCHCAFYHEKPRCIDGLFVAPDKGPLVKKEKEEETSQDDSVSSVSSNIPSTTNPQLRGVIKVETQESVPSPTHPPVVINPVDDEDDEDDQVSEEGDDVSSVYPKKRLSPTRDGSRSFGIKTLKEVRQGKDLKAKLNGPGHSLLNIPGSFTSTKQYCNGVGRVKETIQFVTRNAVVSASESPTLAHARKRKITDRLGKRFGEAVPVEGGLRLKGSLAKRLGGFVDCPQNKVDVPRQKVKALHERLGISPDSTASKSPNDEPEHSGEIRIKTLAEIRQEKAAKSLLQLKGERVVPEVPINTPVATKKANKPINGPTVKTFSEILHEKKKLQETKASPDHPSGDTEKNKGPEIRVKTLEEILKEKAARMQAQTLDTADDSPSSSEAVTKKVGVCSGNTRSAIIKSQKEQDLQKMGCGEKPSESNGKRDGSIQDVTVKSFEEIMREKRLRKQQEQDPERSAQNPVPVLCEKKTSDPVRPEVPIPVISSVQQDARRQSSSPVLQRQPLETQNKENSRGIRPKKCTSSSSMVVPAQVSELEDSSGQHSQNTRSVSRMSPNQAAELKVRPKLNVKPSVMKPAAQVKPGQKRKATALYRSAVAAVKPLTALLTPAEETSCKRVQLCGQPCKLEAEARVQDMASPAEHCSLEPLSLSQSSIIKSPTQHRPRRASVASARGTAPPGNSSSMDDFEDLLDEFTDDRLESEIELDPGKGEDDLLLELSEMIDS